MGTLQRKRQLQKTSNICILTAIAMFVGGILLAQVIGDLSAVLVR